MKHGRYWVESLEYPGLTDRVIDSMYQFGIFDVKRLGQKKFPNPIFRTKTREDAERICDNLNHRRADDD